MDSVRSVFRELEIYEIFRDLESLKYRMTGSFVAPSHEGLYWLKTKLMESYPDDLELPDDVRADEQGRIFMKWIDDHVDNVSLLIDLQKKCGLFFDSHFDPLHKSKVMTSTRLCLENPKSWNWLAEQLRSIGFGITTEES